jgi:hypothetical protein
MLKNSFILCIQSLSRQLIPKAAIIYIQLFKGTLVSQWVNVFAMLTFYWGQVLRLAHLSPILGL